MGTSVAGQLNDDQKSALPNIRDAMAAASAGAAAPTRFTFAAFFDGTNNDRSQYAPDSTIKPQSGDPFPTNVANLYEQAENIKSDFFVPRYLPGIGTGDERGGQINAGVAPNAPANAIAEKMYQDFRKAVIAYRDEHPDATAEDVSVTTVGGSRGGAVSIKFMQMVNDRDLVDDYGNVIAPRGSIPAVSPVFLDPVGRFIDGDLSLPPNVRGPVLSIQAADENRSDFRPLDFSNDERVTTVVHPGNHVGVLGGYDQGGTASNVLEGVTAFMQNAGERIADVPVEQRFDPTQETKLYTEAYQTDAQGNVLTNENGSKLLAWKVDDPAQGRQLDSPQHPEAQTEEQLAANSAALVGTLASMAHWSEMTDVQRAASFSALYNTVDHMNNGELAGDLGGAASALSFVSALQNGNAGSVVFSGVSLANALGEDFASKEIASAIGVSGAAANVVPGLSLALAIDSGNSMSMVAAAANFIPVYGPLISVGISLLGPSLFGDDDPPAPVGSVHFGWDANGHIQHTVDFNQSGGGDAANSVAASVQSMLEQVVAAANAKNPSTADDLAINPYCLPKVGFHTENGATMDITLANGQVASQPVNSPQFSEWLLKVVQDTGGIAPAWQVQTLQMHAQQMREQGADEAQVAAVTGITNTYAAVDGSAASSVQGNAAESADFKSQTFGALVVHLHDDPNVQAAQAQLNTVLRDIDGDGYFEKTQWVSATDTHGNAQGVLTLDFNGNGLIETSDILNLGGNKGQDANPTDAAALATQNADLQRNNVQWLDANGDGVIDKNDPAFAAIKLWVDANQDVKMQTGEGQSLNALHITSINFKTGEVTYADGSTDALTAATLKGDTEGVKLTQIQEAGADGVLHAVNAGDVLEHEGYEGKVQVTDALGTHWVDQRDQTYEQQATRSGDWEGTAEQDAHRHGGGNVQGAPTETSATGATDLGPVYAQANQTIQSTVTEGDARVMSDAPTLAAQTQINAQPNAQTTLTAGDARIKSNAAAPSTKNTSTTSNTSRPPDTRIVFVPTSQTSVQNEIKTVTGSMLESSQSMLFGAAANAGLGVLAAVGMGAVQSAQASEQRPALVSDVVSSNVSSAPNLVSSDNTFSPTFSLSSTDSSTSSVTFKQVDLGTFNVPQIVPVVMSAPQIYAHALGTTSPNVDLPTTSVSATVIVNPPVLVTANHAPVDAALSNVTHTASVAATNAPTLGYPDVQGETLLGTEDVVFRLSQSVLLANDSTPNASADPNAPALTITAVSQPLNGQVSLVNGEVLFAPDANFHGIASFTYTVTDQYGLSSNGTTTLQITAVNDAPVTQGEFVSSDEDIGLIFTQAQLLANDSDVDVATDGQVLTISRVGQAQHGTVWIDAQGDLRFVPDANYHGAAQFTYWVSDGLAANGAGAETPATVSLTIAAVNDIPVAHGETTNTQEDATLYIDAATLLANDSDADVATDGQVLSISEVSNAAHCTVNLNTQSDGTQHITFVPHANFHGIATFDYTVSDGNGGTAVATAVINLSAVNDAPVTSGETATGDEDNTFVFTSHDLLANDTDVDVATDGQVLSISRVGEAMHGTVTLDAQGQVHFTPDANYHGSAQFTYWVSDGLVTDGAGAEVPATVNLTILAVNDLPVVTGEAVNTNEDTTLLFNPATLLANDTDVDVATDGQVLSITEVSNATHGIVEFVTQSDGSQQIRFTPDANYFGVASYQYNVSDGAGGNTLGTVVINLVQVNDTPVASNDTLSDTAEDTALHISFSSLLSNDKDADSHNSQWGGVDDVLTVSAVGNATHGSVAMVNGEVVFTPDANYHGAASFAYQVVDLSGAVAQAIATFTVTSVNDLPVAVGETISSSEDTTLVINQAALLQNDSDVDVATDGQVLSITTVSNAQHGNVTLNADGTISFVPDTNYFGNASFDYVVDDGNGGTAIATATIALANVNDAPVATGETISSNEDEILTIAASALLQNDSDIDNAHSELMISRVQSGIGGVASLNANGDVIFTPTANYNGTATFTYWVKDPGGLESNAVTTTIQIAPVNDPPVAQGETVTGASEDAVFHIDKATLLANDHDVDDPDSALSLSWVGNSSGGSVSLDASGNVVFTPDLNFNGKATFQYKVRDPAGAESLPVQAVIPVTPVNDAPVAVDDQFTTYTNSTMTIGFDQLTSNDTDVDHDSLTVSAVRDNANGHASILNGQVQFVANSNFTGTASFDYLTDDSHGGQSWATAFVEVKTPPHLYPTVDISSFNFYGSQGNQGRAIDVAYATWHAVDDGNAGAVTFQLQQIIVSGGYYGSNWSSVQNATQYQFDSTHMYIDVRVWSAFTKMQCTTLLTDDRGLQNIWHFNYDIATGYTSYADHTGYYAPPVILDLNGDGVHFTSLQNSKVSIDVNHDGINDKMAWAGNDDGVLVWDKDHNHQITDASEFGFQTLKAGAQTDLEGLQALDTNGNGLLDAGDAKFAEFAVWQDANGNGVTDAGEFKTLTELGIANINLHSDGQMRDAGTLLANSGSGETDATVMGNAAFTRTDGSTGVVADTMLAYEAGHATQAVTNTSVVDASVHTLVSAPQSIEISANATPQVVDTSASDAQTAEIIRQALLFNQVCNTAVAIDSTPLGFVPIQPDVQLHDMLVAPQDGSHLLMHSA